MYHVSAQGVDEGMINVHSVVVVVAVAVVVVVVVVVLLLLLYILSKTCSWFNLACRQQNSNKYTGEISTAHRET